MGLFPHTPYLLHNAKQTSTRNNMTKGILYHLLVLLAFAQTAWAGEPETFEFFENFDDASHFTLSATVPDGWLSEGTLPFKRQKTRDYGVAGLSGDYAIVADNSTEYTRNDVLYSPLMQLTGGKPCTVSFFVWGKAANYSEVKNLGLNVRAGKGQNLEAQTIEVGVVPAAAYAEWTEFQFTFTPETDGEYSISFAIDATTNPQFNMKGNFMIDDVSIKGWTGESEPPVVDDDFEPNPDNAEYAEELPYSNTFDNLDNDYDGTSYLPRNWQSTGTMPFITGAIADLSAVTGDWYLVTEQTDMPRDERLYTPFFDLEAGREYHISYYIYMPGYMTYSNLRLTAGYEQDADFQPYTLQEITERSITNWEKQEVTFVPKKSGLHCFALQLTSESGYAGRVAFEDFSITAPHIQPYPRPTFSIPGTFELEASSMLTYGTKTVQASNLSTNADLCHWTVERPDGTTVESEAYEPYFDFDQWGTYNVTLKATNARGERSTTHTYNVLNIDGSYNDFSVTTWNPNEDKLYDRLSGVPAFETAGAPNDTERDYATGFNRYYTVFAERYEMDDETKTTIKSLLFTEAYYRLCPSQSNSDMYKPFSMVVYGETDGKLDETKVWGRYDSTVGEVFGNRTVSGSGGGDMLGIQLETPITATGTFYVAFEFPSDITVVIEDPQVGRSFLGLSASRHKTEVATLYCKPRMLPQGSTAKVGEWCRVDEVREDMKGVGFYLILWVDFNNAKEVAIRPIHTANNLSVSRNANELTVTGTTAGEALNIYTADGRLVRSLRALDAATNVRLEGLPHGIYLLKTGDATVKFER